MHFTIETSLIHQNAGKKKNSTNCITRKQALRKHQLQLNSPTLPAVASTSGVVDQEPRPCAVDVALGLVEYEGGARVFRYLFGFRYVNH